MPAEKSGNHIYITGVGNNLDSIVSNINDPDFIYQDRTNHAVVNCSSVNRYLSIREGGELNVGGIPQSFDGAGYGGYALEFKTSTSTDGYGRLEVTRGGTLNVYGDSVIDLGSGSRRSDFSYIHGKMYVTGSDSYKPVIQNAYQIRFYETINNDTYNNDIWTWNNVILGSSFLAGGTTLAFFSMGQVRNHSFTNLLFDKTYGRNQNCRALSYTYSHPSYGNMTMENWTVRYGGGGGYYKIIGPAGGILKNFSVGKDTTDWSVAFSGPQQKYVGTYNEPVRGSEDQDTNTVFGQSFALLDGWTFESSSSSTSDMLARYGTSITIKDCTFQNTTGTRLYLESNSTVRIWSGNTLTGGQSIVSNSNINTVYDLDLTVQDRQGNPIENALVYIRQSQGFEEFVFQTKSNGKLANCCRLEVALLTNLNRYATSLTRYWSDDSNDTYHEVIILKSGYRPVTKTFVMDQSRTDTIVLDRINARSLAF